jgi:hypothetical protein
VKAHTKARTAVTMILLSEAPIRIEGCAGIELGETLLADLAACFWTPHRRRKAPRIEGRSARRSSMRCHGTSGSIVLSSRRRGDTPVCRGAGSPDPWRSALELPWPVHQTGLQGARHAACHQTLCRKLHRCLSSRGGGPGQHHPQPQERRSYADVPPARGPGRGIPTPWGGDGTIRGRPCGGADFARPAKTDDSTAGSSPPDARCVGRHDVVGGGGPASPVWPVTGHLTDEPRGEGRRAADEDRDQLLGASTIFDQGMDNMGGARAFARKFVSTEMRSKRMRGVGAPIAARKNWSVPSRRDPFASDAGGRIGPKAHQRIGPSTRVLDLRGGQRPSMGRESWCGYRTPSLTPDHRDLSGEPHDCTPPHPFDPRGS